MSGTKRAVAVGPGRDRTLLALHSSPLTKWIMESHVEALGRSPELAHEGGRYSTQSFACSNGLISEEESFSSKIYMLICFESVGCFFVFVGCFFLVRMIAS